MKLIHTENYEAMSKEAADLLMDTLRKKPDAVICLATGSSPARMYELVCEWSRAAGSLYVYHLYQGASAGSAVYAAKGGR